MNFPTHRPCVSIIVLKPRETKGYDVLLVHKPRKRDTWQIPQGGIEEGETVEEAGRRELMEETKIDPQGNIIKCPQFYQYDYPKRFTIFHKPKYAGQLLDFVCCKVPKNTVVKVDQRELDAFQWVRPSKIWRYLKRRSYRRTVLEAVKWAENELFRN